MSNANNTTVTALEQLLAAGPKPQLTEHLQLQKNPHFNLRKATPTNISVRRVIAGLSKHDLPMAAQAIVNRQLTEQLGEAGREWTTDIAARIADLLDVYVPYVEALEQTAMDTEAISKEYFNPEQWAATPKGVQAQLLELVQNNHRAMVRHVKQEMANMAALLEQVDRSSPPAIRAFERRRLERRPGMKKRDIERILDEMQANGLLG